MNKIVTAFSLTLFLFTSTFLIGQTTTEELKIYESDIGLLVGDWEGSLTYLDYTSNKPYSMPCNVSISSNKNKNRINLQYKFPNEPKANSKEKIKISKDGTQINNEKITARVAKSDSDIEIQVETSGKDGNDNKPAQLRQSYIISDGQFIIRKEVKYVGTEEWLLRNEFKFSKS